MGEGRGDLDEAGGQLTAENVEDVLDFLESLSPELFSVFASH
jgi:hypothetical protein